MESLNLKCSVLRNATSSCKDLVSLSQRLLEVVRKSERIQTQECCTTFKRAGGLQTPVCLLSNEDSREMEDKYNQRIKHGSVEWVHHNNSKTATRRRSAKTK